MTPRRPAKDQTRRHRYARGKGSRVEAELVALERQVRTLRRPRLELVAIQVIQLAGSRVTWWRARERHGFR